MTGSSHAWTPELGDKLGDQLETLTTKYGISKVLEVSRYRYIGEEIHLDVLDHSTGRHFLQGKTIYGDRLDYGYSNCGKDIMTSNLFTPELIEDKLSYTNLSYDEEVMPPS
ncbi:hypothetical protein AVEN_150485-1 [Araneus ventricosus]|uniref:Uncharacterized protein n=1 Tax=Araneus ventricosus TaxID=182803 RepID=A0A4Y2H8R0_ARAVE|nr:hypothetical protein AVEN_150485-1 [Araneus ventricosus]